MATDGLDHYARATWVNDCVPWSGEEEDLGDAVRIRDSGSRYLRNDVNGAPLFNGVSADGEDIVYQAIDRRVTEAGDFDIRLASPVAGEKVSLPLAVLFKLIAGDPIYPVPATRPLGTIQTSVVLEDNESFESEGGWFGFYKGTGETRDLGVFDSAPDLWFS